MPDKIDFQVDVFEHFNLERENHHQPVDDFGHFGNPSAIPRPDLRTDIVKHFDAALFEFAGQTQIEARIVHQQRGVRLAPIRLRQHFLEGAFKKRITPEHFGDAEHVHLTGVVQQFHALGAEFVAADSPEGQIRTFYFQRTDHISRMHIAGIFARYDQK